MKVHGDPAAAIRELERDRLRAQVTSERLRAAHKTVRRVTHTAWHEACRPNGNGGRAA